MVNAGRAERNAAPKTALPRTMGIAMKTGLSPTDPLTLAGAAVLLMVTTVLAASMPAWRAARIDPVTALRYE